MNFNIVAADAASTVDTIKSGAINTAQWLGHQITVIKDTVLTAIAKIVEYAKPLFENLAQYFGELFESAREWVNANREIAVPVGVGGIVAVFAGVAGYVLLFNKGEEKPATQPAP